MSPFFLPATKPVGAKDSAERVGSVPAETPEPLDFALSFPPVVPNPSATGPPQEVTGRSAGFVTQDAGPRVPAGRLRGQPGHQAQRHLRLGDREGVWEDPDPAGPRPDGITKHLAPPPLSC